MRRDFFEFDPIFKLLIVGNHRPGLRSVDEAIRRRLHMINFDAVIPPTERDATLGDKLKAEWPGVLAWAIEGCLAWQAHGLLPPAAVQSATASYLEAEDSLAAWAKQVATRDANAFETATDLFRSWETWAKRAGEWVGSLKKFSQRLEDRAACLGLCKRRNERGRRLYRAAAGQPGEQRRRTAAASRVGRHRHMSSRLPDTSDRTEHSVVTRARARDGHNRSFRQMRQTAADRVPWSGVTAVWPS